MEEDGDEDDSWETKAEGNRTNSQPSVVLKVCNLSAFNSLQKEYKKHVMRLMNYHHHYHVMYHVESIWKYNIYPVKSTQQISVILFIQWNPLIRTLP